MSSIDKKLNKVMDAIISMDTKIDLRLDTMEKQNKLIIEEFRNLQNDVNKISEKQEILVTEVEDIKMEFEVMKQNALENNLIITGFPDLSDNTNLFEVLNTALKEFGLKDLNEEVIRKIYLLKNKEKLSAYIPICVEFYSKFWVDKIFALQKKNGPILLHRIIPNSSITDTRKIFFKHRMTPYNNILFKEAFKLKEQNKYCFVWFQQGSVLMKKASTSGIVKIRSKEDLDKIIEADDDIN